LLETYAERSFVYVIEPFEPRPIQFYHASHSDKLQEKTKSRHHNAGQNRLLNSSRKMAKFKCMGKTATNQNCINKDIISRLHSGNDCYHPVQYILSSRFLSENVKDEIHKTTFYHLFCMIMKLGLSY